MGMGRQRRHTSSKLLSSSRPGLPSNTNTAKTLSSKSTRTLIRSYHNLHKKLKQAEARGSDSEVAAIRRQIEACGGIQAYQRASLQGQSNTRGGDSSKILVEWIRELHKQENAERQPSLRLLEVGSLKVDNACARSGLFEMVRIDLNSQHRDILEQDFMKRPAPSSEQLEAEGFDILSLSLVVNYVPDPVGRGEMLRRSADFLRNSTTRTACIPGLFLVLPAPCVLNSRYLTEERLELILGTLGYETLKKKTTNKLVYYYLHLRTGRVEVQENTRLCTEKVRDGKRMNNFSIVV